MRKCYNCGLAHFNIHCDIGTCFKDSHKPNRDDICEYHQYKYEYRNDAGERNLEAKICMNCEHNGYVWHGDQVCLTNRGRIKNVNTCNRFRLKRRQYVNITWGNIRNN